MQGRAVAIYGLVFFLVAAGVFAFVTVAEGPEPSLDSPEHALAMDDSFVIEGPDGTERNYTVTEFGVQVGQPTATFTWTNEDAQAFADLEHAEEPDGTTVVSDGTEYWVIVPQDQEEFETFTLLEVPDTEVTTTGEGDWIAEVNGTWEPIENLDLEQIELGVGDTFPVTEEVEEPEDDEAEEDDAEDDEPQTITREYLVEGISEEAVTVSFTEAQEEDVVIRQTERQELNGVEYTAHFPSEGTVQLTSDPDAIDQYLQTHEDRNLFDERIGGLQLSVVLSALSALLLVGLAFLPRKE